MEWSITYLWLILALALGLAELIAHYFPEKAQRIADYEQQFGTTISRDKLTVLERARRSRPFEIEDLAALEQATRPGYTLPVFAAPGTPWVLPAGSFRSEGCGAS